MTSSRYARVASGTADVIIMIIPENPPTCMRGLNWSDVTIGIDLLHVGLHEEGLAHEVVILVTAQLKTWWAT